MKKTSPLSKPQGSANKLGAGIISHSPTSKATLVTVLSNVRHTYITSPGEGFLPSDTARHHRAWVTRVIKEAVKKAGIRMQDLDCIAFTKGWSAGRKNVIYALRYPAHRRQSLRGTIFGETLDIAIGNCLDRFARVIGLRNDPSPGYNIEVQAKSLAIWYQGNGRDTGWTAAFRRGIYPGQAVPVMGPKLGGGRCHHARRSLLFATRNNICNVGGDHGESDGTCWGQRCVDRNERLQQMMGIMAMERGGRVFATDERWVISEDWTDDSFCIDNGIMIAQAGLLAFRMGQVTPMEKTSVTQRA
ncbi:hypothetical protein P7C73_g107, partial [Tremellales sp. Uapishka_1]